MRRVYLDVMASAPTLPEVAALWTEWSIEPGNASSIHHHGRCARAAIDEAAERLAALLDADPDGVIWTSGGSEANNLAIAGAARALRGRRTRIITTAIEHPSVLAACRALEAEGFLVTVVPPDRDGRVAPGRIATALGDDAALVSVMWANNETGVIQPIEEIGALCRARGVFFHSDASQAAGKLAVAARHVDALTISGHKLFAPQGIGALWVRPHWPLHALIHGGEQQRGRRAGTEPAALCAALGLAARIAADTLAARASDWRRLVERLWSRLRAAIPDIRRHGDPAHQLPCVLHIGIPGVRGELLVPALDLVGVSASHGSACASGAAKPSHVLLAMGYAENQAREAVRLSPLPWASEADMDFAAEMIAQCAAHQRQPAVAAGAGKE